MSVFIATAWSQHRKQIVFLLKIAACGKSLRNSDPYFRF